MAPTAATSRIAEPTFELEVHQLGQGAADERPRYVDQKISKQAMIARYYFLSDPAGMPITNMPKKPTRQVPTVADAVVVQFMPTSERLLLAP